MKIIDLLKLKYHNLRFKFAKDISAVYKLLLKYGYIEKDCTPIKCTHCGSTNLEATDFDYGGDNIPPGVLCEYRVVCKDCNSDCGHWAYGGWSL